MAFIREILSIETSLDKNLPYNNPDASEITNTSELFRYTRAVQNGYIHMVLKDINTNILKIANHSSITAVWSDAIKEEIAFREFKETGVLPLLLDEKAATIASRFKTEYAKKLVGKEEVFALRSSNDTLLGRSCSALTRLNQWLRGNEPLIMAVAARSGYLELVQWLREQNYQWDTRACSFAAHAGHLSVLQWLREHGCPWDTLTPMYAIRGDHLEVLQWLREQGCPWNSSSCLEAATNGNLPMLQWLRENGCQPNAFTTMGAAFSGNLPMLQWLREIDCPWNGWVCVVAIITGNITMLRWAQANGCPLNAPTTYAAILMGNPELVEWVRNNGGKYDRFARILEYLTRTEVYP